MLSGAETNTLNFNRKGLTFGPKPSNVVDGNVLLVEWHWVNTEVLVRHDDCYNILLHAFIKIIDQLNEMESTKE